MLIQLCQIDTTVGAFQNNVEKILTVLDKQHAHSKGKRIFVFPELTIPGYPLLDLVDNSNFIDDQLKALEYLLQQTSDIDSLIIVGYLEKNTGPGKSLFNSAAVCYKGQIIYNYRKRLLPTYDIFDEARYFEPGTEMGLFHYRGVRIGLVICEDLWYENKLYKINPTKDLFNANAKFIISINGSPSIVRKHEQKVKMIKNISLRYALPIVYVNQVGGNDDIVFDGNSFVTNEKGKVIYKLKKFEEQTLSLHSDDLHYHAIQTEIEHKPFDSDAQFFYEQAVFGIKSYIQKCGFPGVVIGESGGIDSAVVTALAADAIGADKVVGITMPSKYSSNGSFNDSKVLCENLGVRFYTCPIDKMFSINLLEFDTIPGDEELRKSGVMEENLQARIRGMILMSYSNRYKYLVLSTGNKSELSVGYCTMYGDMCGGLSPISGLYKTEVYAVAKYINEYHNKEIIPKVIIDKEPSAELSPNQKDTDSLPPYPILDALLKLFIEGELLDENEKNECLSKIILEDNINSNYIKKVLNLLKNAEFKRRQMPIGIKMHKKDFGFGRRIPIAQNWNVKTFYQIKLQDIAISK